MPNVLAHHKKSLSPFRRIAIGTWEKTYDPSVYGTLEVRMDEAAKYLEAYREKTGRRLTYTHLITKAIARAFREVPDANSFIRLNRIYQRKQVDVFLQVVLTDEETGETDLSGAKIENADELPLHEIVDRLQKKAERIRARKDKELEKTRSSFRFIPSLFLNLVLKVLSFVLYTLNWDMRWAGLPKDSFGSVMLTSIGSLGLDQAYVPLVPYSHCPMVVAAGRVREIPWVVDGEIKPCLVVNLNTTFDHRIIDGAQAASLCRVARRVLEHPFEELDDFETGGPN
jgi:pyruvate dehydrogenase E2 component (dihydrolipoamide acetyltransferase)